MAKKIISKLYLSLALLCAVGVSVLVILTLSSVLESSQPVMRHVKPHSAFNVTPTAVVAHFIGEKQRNCRRIPESENGYYKDGWLIHETTMTYVDDATPDSSFPPGVVDLGHIRWDIPLGIKATEVGFTVAHECGKGMVTAQFWFKVE